MNAPLFIANLAATALFLVATLVAGKRGVRPLHYALAVTTVLLLGAAIWQAEMFGRDYSFSTLRLNVHLGLAFAALLALPAVVGTGLRLRVRPSARPAHRTCVLVFVVLTVLAILTAGWMFLDAVPLEPADSSD